MKKKLNLVLIIVKAYSLFKKTRNYKKKIKKLLIIKKFLIIKIKIVLVKTILKYLFIK